MDIKLFIESLSKQEQVDIFHALKPIVEKEETVSEFKHNREIPVRLFNLLSVAYSEYHGRGNRLVSMITKNEFIKISGAGEKMWVEFVKARGY